MANPEVVSEAPITMAEVGECLKKVKREDLGYRAAKTLEYIEQIHTPEAKKVKDTAEKLIKLDIPRLKENHIIKIVELAPKTPEEVRLVLQGYLISVSNENVKKIVDVIAS